MKIAASFFPVFGLCLLLTGCIRPDLPGAEADARVLRIGYSFDTPKTRAASTAAERALKDVAVLFYKADNASPDNETYVDCRQADLPEGGTSSSSFPLTIPPGIRAGEPYKLIIIGNYREYAPEGKSLAAYAAQYAARTYSEMRKEIYAQVGTANARVTTPLPFRGTLVDKKGDEATLTGPDPGIVSPDVSVKFNRAVARVDVVNLAADKLKIAWAKLCNYRDKGYLYNDYFLLGNFVRGAADAPPAAGAPYPAGYVAGGEPDTSEEPHRQSLTSGGLYAFPNTAEHPLQGDEMTTCLLVAGYYKASGATDYSDQLTYYRANVNKSGESQALRPNYIYTLLINNVKKAGAKAEEDALAEKGNLLEYVVGVDWDSESAKNVTDAAGNFLTVSSTSVSVGSKANDAAVVQVLVKSGTGYTASWGSPEDANLFDLVIKDDRLSIVAKSENETTANRTATATVSLTGGGASALSIPIDVRQLAAINDPARLKVSGHTKDFEYSVPDEGDTIAWPVLAGESGALWTATADAALGAFMGTSTLTGESGTNMQIEFPLNQTRQERRGTLTVRRNPDDGDSITVTFVQPSVVPALRVTPDCSKEPFVMGGFSAEPRNQNGIAARQEFEATPYFANTSLLTLYNTPTVTTNFKSPDAKVSIANGKVLVEVYRTGPGDPDITGEFTVTATPKVVSSDTPLLTYTGHIIIRTNCRIGDAKIGSLLWADRNVGATPRGEAPVGLNYTNDTASPDHQNTGFRGGYYTFTAAPDKCAAFGTDNQYEGTMATGWRVPSMDEQTVVAGRMCFSKQRGFIVSDDTTAGTVGCWFPLSGWSITSPTTLYGYFWSSTPDDSGYGYAYSLRVYTEAAGPGPSEPSSEFSVRCVRPIN